MKNNKVISFLKSLRKNSEDLVKNPKPKFEIGDIIMNNKFKVISIVTNIAKVWNKDNLHEDRELHYILVDLENKAAKEHFSRNGMVLNMEKRKRFKLVRKIDPTYHKIDPTKAQILFGKSVEDLKAKYTKGKNNERF